jgi:death on curing protein
VNDIEYLDLEDLLRLIKRIDVGPVRDLGILEAACARPRTSVFGADAYPSVPGKAAALLHSIVRGHGLVDGNKRLGWLGTVIFLDINVYPIDLSDDSAFDLVMAVAEGTLDVDDITVTLQIHLKIRPSPTRPRTS